ncbi:MAG: type II toxin-antitoxin system VapC family toxin [Acidobacteriota bacterium]|nr:type II toxin-antitoxin system VapC family toxin [Acidobacteriota bacterium]
MVIPDANLLIYAYNPDAVHHQESIEWLELQFQGRDPLGFTWPTLWAFARVATNPRLWPRSVSAEEVFSQWEEWLEQPNAIIVGPGPRHTHILHGLVTQSGVVGSMISDAVLAAIAIEHAATLASTDRDFRRFSGLRWINPLE